MPLDKQEEAEILDYLRVIWRRAWLIALIFVLTTGIAFAVSSLLDEEYEAEITFRIIGQQGNSPVNSSRIPSSTLTALGIYGGDRDLQTYSHVLKSRNIISDVMRALPQLEETYTVPSQDSLMVKLRGIFRPHYRDARKRLGEEEFRRRILHTALRESISVRQPGGDVLSVRIRWTDPKQAADIANEMGRAFISYDTAARQKATDRTLTFIQNAIRGDEGGLYSEAGVERALAEAERKLRDFKKKHKVLVIQEEAKQLIGKLVDAEDDLSSALISRKMAEARFSDIQGQLRGQDQMMVSARTVTDNPIIQQLQKEMTQLEIQSQSLGAELGEANPELRDIESQIEEYRKRIEQFIRDDPKITSQETTSANPLYQFLRQEEINSLIDITILKAKEAAIKRRIEILEKELARMPDAEMQLASLTREVDTYSRIYATLRQSESEAQLARESIFTNISILDRPEVPIEPAAPKVALNTALGGVVGLILGFSVAFFIEYIQRARRSARS